MSRLVMKSVLAVAIAGSSFVGAGAAHAGCYGSHNVGKVCEENAVIYDDCFYFGPDTCAPVHLEGPTCIYSVDLLSPWGFDELSTC